MRKLLALCWFILAGTLCGQAVLEPPFGLKWGNSPDQLLDWAGRHDLDIRITMPGKQPDMRIFRVESPAGTLPSSQARAVEGRFIQGRLIEVTIHHGNPGALADTVEKQFNETRRELARKHGKLTANQQERRVEDQFSTRTLSFHREPVQGLFLLLAFTEVEDLLRKSRSARFSIIYRNDNLRRRLEAAPATGGGTTGSK
ncbi:hypothetical protein [Haloferula rosea]|uniref:Uncharacterized protein n=1 Tax=Haloferula rosea TaxID=490093 RepID=A0A934REC9_9BACT|nr:hypothetical protein [Haloferula rosea]MBK1827664.1 hypothetical protein [Haloferula rosea]